MKDAKEITPLHSFYEYDKAYDIVTLLQRKFDMAGLSENENNELNELTERIHLFEQAKLSK